MSGAPAVGSAGTSDTGRAAEKVVIVGSGNWGSAIARIIGHNAARLDAFNSTVQMWVYEEDVEVPDASGTGLAKQMQKLTEVINTRHENVKYLPGVLLPDNVVANPSLRDAAAGATMVVFVLPHQFLPRILPDVSAVMAPDARAISLIKGIDFDEKGLVLISETIRAGLGDGVSTSVAVLMGANVAKEVARDEFAEATIGCDSPDTAALWRGLFHTPTFRVNTVRDTATVELCGALKNVVALGAGFCDGLGMGGNTKAAVIRIGLQETIRFCRFFYGPATRAGAAPAATETFLESCGVADLITTCYGGRNRKCAEAFARRWLAKAAGKEVLSGELEVSSSVAGGCGAGGAGAGGAGDHSGAEDSAAASAAAHWASIESELLGGQKLQGTLTSREVHAAALRRGVGASFPLFRAVHAIAFEGAHPRTLFDLPEAEPLPSSSASVA